MIYRKSEGFFAKQPNLMLRDTFPRKHRGARKGAELSKMMILNAIA
jgi:hypothetical protein